MKTSYSPYLDQLAEKESQALQTFVAQVQHHFPNQIRAILLFGSRARGDATVNSDMDLLIVMPTVDLETRQAIRHIATEIWLTDGFYLSTRIWSEAHWQEHAELQTMFYHNLQQDAVSVLDAVPA